MAEQGDDGNRLIPGTWVHSDRFVPRAFVQPTLAFMRTEAASGILMLVAAVIAVVWANSPAQDSYFELFETTIDVTTTAPEEHGGEALGAEEGDGHASGEVDGTHAGTGADIGADIGATAVASPQREVTAAESGSDHGEGIGIGPLEVSHLPHLTVRDWINDALMALFFFVVGLEIKRELVVGELRDPKAAALPAVAALGGMVIPAALYLVFNLGTESGHGWGIPMATDIAFAVGVLSMVGRRVPVAAKLFLLTLAIVDDLGAILVIAIFYTEQLFFGWLAVATVGLLVVYAMQRVHIRSTAAYIVVGSIVWLAVLESGVHATIAGVALALMTPVKAYLDPTKFAGRADALVARAKQYIPHEAPLHEQDHHTLERVQVVMTDLRTLSRESIPPLSRLEYKMQPWTSYVVVPLFALANAGVIITSDMFDDVLGDRVLVGIFVGLLVGKVLGVVLAAWIAVRLGIGRMPRNMTWAHMVGVGLLAGIGFTVALFVAALSFETGSPFADSAKLGIFAASILAGVGGFAWLRLTGGDDPDDRALPGDPAAEDDPASHDPAPEPAGTH